MLGLYYCPEFNVKVIPLRCRKCNAIQSEGRFTPSHCYRCGCKKLVRS
jgi:hypothetical protein